MEDYKKIIAELNANFDKLIELNDLSLSKIAMDKPEYVHEARMTVSEIKTAIQKQDYETLTKLMGKYADSNPK